jgi:tannase/feruloyl esterase
MPTAGWNGKFLAVGNGGFGGSIQGYDDMAAALARGYAAAGNDTGHSDTDGPNGEFAFGHPERLIDYAYRAMHETAVEANRVISAFYGQAPRLSYYMGCSTGGRQGIMSAIRYPDDFDAIIAGAVANPIHILIASAARDIELSRQIDGAISTAKAQLVTAAVLRKCDTLKEGFLNDPRSCTFEFKQLACTNGVDSEACLTSSQLKTVEEFYSGTRNGKGGLIFPGQVLGNPMLPLRAPEPAAEPNDLLGMWAFNDAHYDWRQFDVDRDMPIIDSRIGFIDAIDPDLSAFKKHGGKLLLYAGWSDAIITPANTVKYYESVLNKMGKEQNDWVRLFMVPGMNHCGGGLGVNTFDSLGAIDQWRDKATAPAEMIGFNPRTLLTRPICPYPQNPKYRGTGNLNDAVNWTCSRN